MEKENLQRQADRAKSHGRRSALTYLAILFAAAFILLLLAFFMQQRHKMPFSLNLMREQAEATVKPDSVRRPFEQREFYQLHLLVAVQDMADDLLILTAGKGAGGKEKLSAGAKHLYRLQENLSLDGRVIGRASLRPVFYHLLVAPEHALARAGGIHQNFVKKSRPGAGKLLRAFAYHTDIGGSGHFQIF